MKFLTAKKIIAFGGDVQNAAALILEKTLQIGLFETNLTVLNGISHIIVDFGKEISGGVRILTFAIQGDKKIRLRFGESVSETCAEVGEKNATNDHALRDFTTELQDYSDMNFGQTGFRFLRIDITDKTTKLFIKTIVASSDMDEREELGTFECNDIALNDIWKTAAYTLRLCLKNGYIWDGIKRDRLVWIGDLYPEMRAAHCLFGNIQEITNSLDFAKYETFLPNWMSHMPAYSLWWLIIQHDNYLNSGNLEYIKNNIAYIKPLLEQISLCVSEDGETNYPSNFIDWKSVYEEGYSEDKKEDLISGMFYLTKIAVEKTMNLLKKCNESTEVCAKILTRLNKRKFNINFYKQIASLGVWSGDITENNKKIVLKDKANGMSTFMAYWVLSAIAKYEKYEDALLIIKEYYGGMLSVGATTFWEDFDLSWLENANRIDEIPSLEKSDIHGDNGAYCFKGFRHSLCHGWASGVIPYIIETIAGIKVLKPGCEEILVQPNLSGLEYVKASYPTKFGKIEVEHFLQKDGSVKSNINAPKEIKIIVK